MASAAQFGGWDEPSRRRVPRFRMHAPLEVTILRSGAPEKVPGRALNLCERGIGAMVAAELIPGESVGVEVRLAPMSERLRTRATVRHQDRLRCGLEFTEMSMEQRSTIRHWTKNAGVQSESGRTPAVERNHSGGGGGSRSSRKKRWHGVWMLAVVIIAIVGAAFWWRWNRAWEELESGLKSTERAAMEKPQAQVPAEVMQKLLVHRVEPVYPAEARKTNLQGVIALNVVVGRDGSVLRIQPLNGPEVLARAAMDALRWWKFEPYRLNGEPAVVETTLAVEFKR